MTRLLQLSARCHGDGAPYKAAAGVGLARRARTAPSPSLAGARRPRHGGRGLSPVLARAASRPGRGARGGRRGAGRGGTLPPPSGGWARGCSRLAAPALPASSTRGFRPSGERSAARTTPLKGSARGCGWSRGLRLSQLGNATKSAARAPPGTPGTSLCPQCQRKRKVLRFLCIGVVGGGGKVPRTELAGVFQTKDLVRSG